MKTRGKPAVALLALTLFLPSLVHGAAPAVTAIRRQNPVNELTSATRLVYQVIFNESVREVDTGDFVLSPSGTAAGMVASVSAASGRAFYVTVTNVTGQGSLRLDVRPNGAGIGGSRGLLWPA